MERTFRWIALSWMALSGGCQSAPADRCDSPKGCDEADVDASAGADCPVEIPVWAYLLSTDEERLPDGKVTLVDLGTGAPPKEAIGLAAGCPFEFEPALTLGSVDTSGEEEPQSLVWMQLEQDGSDSWLTVRAPGWKPQLEVGSELRVSLGYECDFQGASDSFIELRDAEGALVFWVGQAPGLDYLDAPREFTLDEGKSKACAHDQVAHSIEIAVDAARVAVPSGHHANVGDYRFTNAYYLEYVGSNPSSDAFDIFVRAALWRR
jgi:hypothetical protein